MSDPNVLEIIETAEAVQVNPGVTPGLTEKATPKQKILFLKCRKEGCDSMKATEIELKDTPPQIGQRVYRCIECGHTWALRVGGPLHL